MVNNQGNGRILFAVGSLTVGGAESQLAMLAERLKMRGWTIEVFPLEKSGALVERLERRHTRERRGLRSFSWDKDCQANCCLYM
jgi:hypothetical protein